MTLDELADASDLPVRRLRYVLDQGLLPGGKFASRGRGAARKFLPLECFGILVAAAMIEAGLKRAPIRASLESLARVPAGAVTDGAPLQRAWAGGPATFLEVGDGGRVRLSGRSGPGGRGAFDSGWLSQAGGGPDPAYEPRVSVRVDAGRIRDGLRGKFRG